MNNQIELDYKMDKIFKKLDNIEQQLSETNKEKNNEVKETLG